MSKIKILHIIKSLGRGGAEMLLPETLQVHNRDAFDFHYIYFLPWKNQMVDAIRSHGGTVTCFPAKNNLMLLTKLRAVAAYVKEHDIQLIHAHLPWAGILARLVGKMTGVPVLYTEHNKQERYHFATRAMNLATMNLLREVIAVSGDVASSIHKHKPKLATPVRTILNGVNLARFDRQLFDKNEIRKKMAIPDHAKVIGTIAVFRFQKRLDLWLEVAAEILKKHPDVHFVLVGDGPLKEMLLEKRRMLGLDGRVHMPGLEKEIRPYLAAIDVYMMTSIFEGLPIALLEAMAMACTVVATDAGGIKEVVRHETDGFLCAVDRPHDLVSLVSTVLGDDDLAERLARQARVRIAEAFSMEKMVGALEQIYREVLPTQR